MSICSSFKGVQSHFIRKIYEGSSIEAARKFKNQSSLKNAFPGRVYSSKAAFVKHVWELASEAAEEQGLREVPDDFSLKTLKDWLSSDHAHVHWASALRGVTKEDVGHYAEAVLKFLSNDASDEIISQISVCVDAFADWEKNWTSGPTVVLKACDWMKSELQHRWREPGILWPWATVHLMFCELGIRAFHRIETKEAENQLAGLVINAAHFFDATPSKTQTI